MAAYKSAFQSYKLFVSQTYDQSTPPLPPRLEHLASFIAHCYQSNLAASTTRTIVSALSFICQLSSFQDFTQHFLIKKNAARFPESKTNM